MQDQDFDEIYFFLSYSERPVRFRGKAHKEKFKSWKRTIKKRYELKARRKGEGITKSNVLLMKCTKKGKKIVVKENQLDSVWEKFHLSGTSGGHPGSLRMNQLIMST